MSERQQYQQCYAIGRNYQVRPKRLTEIDPYWRDEHCKVHYDEDVYLEERAALQDALCRARQRRDQLNDIIDGLQSRLNAMEERELHENIRQAG